MKIDISRLDDTAINQLVDARWKSSEDISETITKTYKANTAVYENRTEWLTFLPERRRRYRVQANRIFVNMEAVINSLIANPPGLNILPARDGMPAQDFARKLESFFRKKYSDLNLKEIVRMGLRNLYFGRLIVIKAFWNPAINDFDFRAIDPRNIRVGKYARKEQDSEFCIEEIEDNLCAVVERFPLKKAELLTKYGFSGDDAEVQMYIKNPDVKYKEAWINDYVIFKLDNIVLGKIKNPYWDWDGVLITDEEETQLNGTAEIPALDGQARRELLQQAKLQQEQRQAQVAPEDPNAEVDPGEQQEKALEIQDPTPPQYKPYYFNYFDNPRKPYIFATIFNNENTPIGRTDMITLSAELQRGIDKRKMDIDENCELVNGILKVDATVMPKADAQRIRFETKGIIWGKGVKDGVTRETGNALPEMVHQDMLDSRSEIDNIMAASSAFRGERDGQETKAGRLALVQQSYLRLNELVQVTDYVSKEIFSWGMQLAKTRYTEYHYAKWMGKEGAREVIELIQDDFETGSEVTIIAGKSLPVDDEFKYEQAQNDVKEGFISPVDYLQIAQYDNAKELSKNAVMYHLSPVAAVGMTPEELQKIPPPVPVTTMKESIGFDDLPPAAKVQVLGRMGITVTEEQIVAEGTSSPVAIAFKDLPPDGQVQAAAKLGIQLDPAIVIAEHTAEAVAKKQELDLKTQAQEHSQKMAEAGNVLKVGDQNIKREAIKKPAQAGKK